MLLTTRRTQTAAPRTTLGALLRPLSTALCAVLCALVAVLGSAAPASAHAVQTDSSPAEGSVVSSAPRQVTVTFSEEVSMSDGSIRVLGPDGKRVDEDKVRVVSGGAVERAVGLKSDVPKGTYTVSWRAVSADSHPVAGAFTFSVGAPSATKAQVAEGGGDSGTRVVDVLYQSARYAAYAGFILLVGGAAFVLACWPRDSSVRRLQRLVVTGWLTLTASTLLMLLLRNSYVGAGELSEVFDLGGVKTILETKPGAALASRLLLLGTSAVIIAVLFGSYGRRPDEPATSNAPEKPDRPEESTGPEESDEGRDVTVGLCLGGGVVAVGLAATWAMAEHASTGVQAELAMPVDVVHMLAVAAWLGGLAALLTSLHWGPPPARGSVRRFSQIAFGSVLTLTATGIYQSWRQLGSWSALTGTSYGQLLLIKVGLVALLVGVAWMSRRWVARLGEVRQEEAATAVREAEPAVVGAPVAGETVEDGEASEAGTGTETGSGTKTGTRTRTVRAAQLARQRAAIDGERRKKARKADPERAALRRSVLAEAGIAVVLLMVTTGLTSTEPGRTEELTRAGSGAGTAPEKRLGPVKEEIPFDTGGPNGKGTAELWITPGQAGDNSLRIMTKGPDGKPLDTSEVKAALTLPLQDLGPIAVPFEPINDEKGRWRSELTQVPLAGDWKVAVTIRTSDIDQVTKTRTVEID